MILKASLPGSAEVLRRLLLVAFAVGALLASLLAMHSLAASHAASSDQVMDAPATLVSPGFSLSAHDAVPRQASAAAQILPLAMVTAAESALAGGVVAVCEPQNALGCAVTVVACALLFVLGSLLLLRTFLIRSALAPAHLLRALRALTRFRFPLLPPSLTVLCVSRV